MLLQSNWSEWNPTSVKKPAFSSEIVSPVCTGETVDSPWRTQREREPQRSDKKDAVLLAGARLFTRQGFQGTSLDDIAKSLGVTKPTLYYYIANKEEILIECVERALTAFQQGLAAMNAATIPQNAGRKFCVKDPKKIKRRCNLFCGR